MLYAVAIIIRVQLNPGLAPKAERMGWGARMKFLGQIWPVVLLFAVVIGGIYLGWFSPTEAAAVGAVGAFLLALASGGRITSYNVCYTKLLRLSAIVTGERPHSIRSCVRGWRRPSSPAARSNTATTTRSCSFRCRPRHRGRNGPSSGGGDA